VHHAVACAIAKQHVRASHDVSDGGWLVGAAEMCIASGFGLTLEHSGSLFVEENGSYLVEIHAMGHRDVESIVTKAGATLTVLGRVNPDPRLEIGSVDADRSRKIECHAFIGQLTAAWRGTLDW
jgi:phosphoribosylformylglycinamidine (FGAM) synthase-like enzyme